MLVSLDIRLLQYFLAIAEEGQFTKAAKRLHIAQPPLSQQLKLLEAELGIQLIERRGSRKIKLTEAGHKLYNRAEQILTLVDQTKKEMQDMAQGLQGTVSIGITIPSSATIGTTLLPKQISLFHRQYPQVKFELWEGDLNKIERLLHDGVIEIAIAGSLTDSDIYETISLPEDVAAAAYIPDCNDKTSRCIRLSDLANKPLIIHRKTEDNFIKLYQRISTTPKIICQHDDIRSMLLWANTGLGVAIVPKSAANLFPDSKLVFKEIVGPTFPLKTSAVAWIKNRYLSTSARQFISAFNYAVQQAQI